MELPKNVSSLKFFSFAIIIYFILSLHTKARKIKKTTPIMIIKNMKMNVDMFARKSVDFIDDASSAALIL